MQAHFKGVVMDIAAFKVSHCVVSDIDATTLQAEKARSASIGAMDESSGKVQNASSHEGLPLRTHKAHGQFSGAMDEMSQKVQNASTHLPMPCSYTRLS